MNNLEQQRLRLIEALAEHRFALANLVNDVKNASEYSDATTIILESQISAIDAMSRAFQPDH